jgi:hypothetical protein
MAKEAVLESVTMILGDDGILRIRIMEGACINLAQAKLQYETIRRLCGDSRVLVLVDATSKHEVDKDAQQWAADHTENRIATAVISSRPFAAITLNLFISLFNPKSTFKLFRDEEKALAWLKELDSK